jgi:hypothetical protein
VPGATVVFQGMRGSTDAAGAYRIEGIDAASLGGAPWMTVEAEGFATATRTFAEPSAWQGRPLEVVLERGRAVAGRVEDEAGLPVRGAQLTLRNGAFGIETVHSGADGRFAFVATATRDATVAAMPPAPYLGWRVPEHASLPADGGAVVVRLHRAPPGSRVVAEVVDAVTGAPLDPGREMLIAADPSQAVAVYRGAPTVSPGRIVYEGIVPGEWTLWVLADGRAAAHVAVRVAPGQEEVRVRVPCPAPGSVRGRVEGLPASAMGRAGMVFLAQVGVASKPSWVELESDPEMINAARLESDGTFLVEGCPPGPLRMWVQLPGLRGETVVEVPAGGTAEAAIRLEAQGRAVFRPTTAPPRPSMLLRIAGGAGDWGHWTFRAPRDGAPPSFATDVPPGRVRWQVRFVEAAASRAPAPDGPPDAEGEFEAKAGETVEVAIPVR